MIDGTGDARVIVALLAAATDLEADERSAAIEALNSIALDADLPRRYRDLAALKSVMLSAGETAASERLIALTPLAQPGAPYRVLAAEQIALAEAEIGNTDAAIAQLQHSWTIKRRRRACAAAFQTRLWRLAARRIKSARRGQ